jgi:hypothetical protein
MSDTTDFKTRCEIIHDFLWHRIDSQEYVRFITDNFAGLVLASTYSLQLAEPISDGIELVNTTFDKLLAFQYGDLVTDTGFGSYDEFIGDIEV